MTKWHSILQYLATILQVLNVFSSTVPTQDKVWVTLAIGIIQVVLHTFASYDTPPTSSTPTPPPPTSNPTGSANNVIKISGMVILCALPLIILSGQAKAQVVTGGGAPTSAFQDTTVNFNLSPISLPGAKESVPGAETDIKLNFTTNNVIGETTLISSDYSFIGGRYDRLIPAFQKWLNNLSPSLSGYDFQLGLTGSIGIVRTPLSAGINQEHWGERAGAFLNYKVASAMGLGVEAQWCNFPGYAHNTYSVAVGPNFHF